MMKKIFKIIYKNIPFKKEIYTVLRFFWTPKKSIYQHLHFNGPFNVKVDKTKSFKIQHFGYQIENEIFWGGLTNGWEKESIKLWINLCESSEYIIDIGANSGVYSLIAKAVNPNSKVYAFEPLTRVCGKLKDNIKLNNYDIVPIEKAVSNHDGDAIVYDIDLEHMYSVTVNKNMFPPGTPTIETRIKTITLDSFIRQENIKMIDLIKIDVETHEPEVLEGFMDYLFVFKPIFLIEILNIEVAERVNAIMKNSDYLFFYIDERSGLKKVDKIINKEFYNYLMCTSKKAQEMGLI